MSENPPTSADRPDSTERVNTAERANTTDNQEPTETDGSADPESPTDRTTRLGPGVQPGPRQSSKEGPSPAGGDHRKVTNRFRRVTIENAFFGYRSNPEDARDSTTGELLPSEVAAAVDVYVPPACFDHARTELLRRRAVILQGPPGSGRRTGALALASHLDPQRMYRIQPGVTLEELQTWDYQEHSTYMVFDHVTSAGEPDAEFRWASLTGRLASIEGVGLIITRSGSIRNIDDVPWERPDPAHLVRRLLESGPAHARAEAVLGALPDDWTVSDVALCCRRLVEGPEDLERALAVFDRAAAREVADWFDSDRPRRDIVEIAAMAFGVGVSERRVEQMADLFEKILAQHVPPPRRPSEPTAELADTLVRPRRVRQSTARELIRRVEVQDDLIPRQVLQFRTEHHWRAVLEELHANFSSGFWDALGDWAHEVLATRVDHRDIAAVAHGVAGLSRVDVEETVSILDGLTSRDDPHVAGIDCAAMTLSMMANEDAVAPLALRIAISWLGQPNVCRRLAAGQALIDDLGLRYTVEASRRLWQLISQDDELSEAALWTPALLFAGLVSQGRDASDLLDMVLTKVERFNSSVPRRRADGSPIPRDSRMVDLTLRMTHFLLLVEDADLEADDPGRYGREEGEEGRGERADEGRRRRTSVFNYLHGRPGAVDTVARLWVALLRNRRYRFAAMQCLWDGLRGSTNRAEVGPLLGSALARHFRAINGRGAGELEQFVVDFRHVDHRKRQRPNVRIEPVADVIIRFLEATHGKPQGENR